MGNTQIGRTGLVYIKRRKVQGATNSVRHIHTYAKETNSLPDAHGKIYCSNVGVCFVSLSCVC